MTSQPDSAQPGPAEPAAAAAAPAPQPAAGQPTTAELISQLQADRLWLLRQIDAGAWPAWRLDLAALERELGELLDRVAEVETSAR